MTESVKFLHHPTSQPCRAVHQLMLETGVPFEEVIVNLMDGENETEDFKTTYNPTGQVPVLVDGDFTLWESAAIGFYLAERFDLPGNWLGRDMRQRALIQQYTHFHSTMLRRGAGAFFYTRFAECIWGPRDYSAEIAMGRYMLEQSMPVLETWLETHSHLCGDEISFADLLGFHEFVSHEAGAIIPPRGLGALPAHPRLVRAAAGPPAGPGGQRHDHGGGRDAPGRAHDPDDAPHLAGQGHRGQARPAGLNRARFLLACAGARP